jgi:hypothetical protein
MKIDMTMKISMANGEPIIRAGCCGSALVHLVEKTEPQDGENTPSKQGISSKESTSNTKGTLGIGDVTLKDSTPGSAASSGLRGQANTTTIC